MTLKKLFYKLFKVCYAEQQGSTEHITEYINTDDIKEVLTEASKNNKEFGTLKNLLEDLVKKGFPEEIEEKLERFCEPDKYEYVNYIENYFESLPHTEKTGGWEKKSVAEILLSITLPEEKKAISVCLTHNIYVETNQHRVFVEFSNCNWGYVLHELRIDYLKAIKDAIEKL